jgi:hypothetical protein
MTFSGYRIVKFSDGSFHVLPVAMDKQRRFRSIPDCDVQPTRTLSDARLECRLRAAAADLPVLVEDGSGWLTANGEVSNAAR